MLAKFMRAWFLTHCRWKVDFEDTDKRADLTKIAALQLAPTIEERIKEVSFVSTDLSAGKYIGDEH